MPPETGSAAARTINEKQTIMAICAAAHENISPHEIVVKEIRVMQPAQNAGQFVQQLAPLLR